MCTRWYPRGSKYSNNRCIINVHDISQACLSKVAAHPIASVLIRKLIKFPIDMATRIVDMQPSTNPILLALRPSPHARAFCIVPSNDRLLVVCIHALKCKCCSMASQIALPLDNVLSFFFLVNVVP